MTACRTCQNEGPRLFRVEMDGQSYLFDSFECAIEALAPRCAHCACRIIGHVVESAGRAYCCAKCAAQTNGRRREAFWPGG